MAAVRGCHMPRVTLHSPRRRRHYRRWGRPERRLRVRHCDVLVLPSPRTSLCGPSWTSAVSGPLRKKGKRCPLQWVAPPAVAFGLLTWTCCASLPCAPDFSGAALGQPQIFLLTPCFPDWPAEKQGKCLPCVCTVSCAQLSFTLEPDNGLCARMDERTCTRVITVDVTSSVQAENKCSAVPLWMVRHKHSS